MYGAPLTALQNALGTAPGASNGFLNAFVKGTDSIGLVTFTSAPYVFIPPGQANGLPNTNFPTTLPPQITNMSPPSFTGTGTAAAISAAYQQLQSLNQPGALNVIVLFTVGLPTGITGNFTGLVTQPTPCSQTVPPPVGVLFTTPLPRFNSIGALADPNGQSVSDNPDLRFAPACIATVAYADPSAFAGGPFLSGIPAADLYGNATLTGPYSPNQNSIDYNDIVWASENALYNAANNIRGAQFPTGNAVPATIGLPRWLLSSDHRGFFLCSRKATANPRLYQAAASRPDAHDHARLVESGPGMRREQLRPDRGIRARIQGLLQHPLCVAPVEFVGLREQHVGVAVAGKHPLEHADILGPEPRRLSTTSTSPTRDSRMLK